MADVHTHKYEYEYEYEAPRIEQRTAIGPMLIGVQISSNIDT